MWLLYKRIKKIVSLFVFYFIFVYFLLKPFCMHKEATSSQPQCTYHCRHLNFLTRDFASGER